MATSAVKIPPATVYRRLVTGIKKNHRLNELVKRLNVGRKIEIDQIAARASLTESDVVCDIGCGDGYWSHFFSCNAHYVIAFDPFIDDLKRATHFSSPHLAFFRSVGEHVPLSAATIDKVVSVCVFEHCYDDQQVFDEIFRILKVGGKLLATVDSLDSPYVSQVHRKWHQQACYCTQLYTAEILTEKLYRAGFRTVETSYIMGSRLAVWWEIMTERVKIIISPLSLFLHPLIVWFEKPSQTSGYKLFVEATK